MAEVVGEYDAVTRLVFDPLAVDVAAVARPFARDGFHPGPDPHDLFGTTVAARLGLGDLTRRSA